MSFNLKIDLRGVKVLQKRLAQLQQSSVEVGFFPEDTYGPDNDNLNVAAVAWMQEKGAGNFPSRPFFTNTLKDSNVRHLLASQLRYAAEAALTPRGNFERALKGAGEALKMEVQYSIETYPGHNSKWWADFKGKDDPLSYTDTMLHSVKVKFK